MVQVDFCGFHSGNAAKLISSELGRVTSQRAVDHLIREIRRDEIFGFVPAIQFDSALAVPDKHSQGH
jgi:hypothetical protein